MKYLILLLCSSCALIGPSIEEQAYCERTDEDYVCPGSVQRPSTLDWLKYESQKRKDNTICGMDC